jgi:hypothetical protein
MPPERPACHLEGDKDVPENTFPENSAQARLQVNQELALRLAETPRMWDMPCQHDTRGCSP